MPKIVDKAERKRELAEVALDAFLERGFEATSVSEIAKRADVGKGTLYEYFDSKEEIILGALNAWIDRTTRAGEQLLGHIDDPVEALREFVHGAMRAYLSDPRAVRLSVSMIQHVLAKREFYAQHCFASKASQAFRDAVAEILRRGADEGVFRIENERQAEKIAINLVAYLDGISLHFMMGEDYFDLEEQIGLFVEKLIDSLAAEPRTGSSGG